VPTGKAGTRAIPKGVAAAIKKCWPDGVVEQFSTDESYFHRIRLSLAADLARIHVAALLWHTQERERYGADWDDDPEAEDPVEINCRGEGRYGCSVGISLVARFAFIILGGYSRFEDGSEILPDIDSCIVSGETNELVDPETVCREALNDKVFQKLETLRGEIAAVLRKPCIQVLEKPVLDLTVPRLKTDPEVFLEAPLRVRDAFFFRGI